LERNNSTRSTGSAGLIVPLKESFWTRKKTEDRGQMTEDRRQRADDRGQMTEGRRRRTEGRSQMTEDRGQKTEVTPVKSCLQQGSLQDHFTG